MEHSRVAAVVPAYNEEKTIADVVQVLRRSPYVQEVIVVSDGSTDRTKERAEEAGAKVIQLSETHGKGGAMLHGVAHTDAPIILFSDADLIQFSERHIERIVLPVLSGSRAMNVGLRRRHPLIDWLLPHLPLIGGERALRRRVIEGIPPKYMRGFMVEVAMNYYCRINGWAYGTVYLRGLKIRRKYEKVGLLDGAKGYVRMAWQVLKAMFFIRLAHIMKRI